MFQTQDAPRYIPAKASIMATLAVVVVVATLLRIYTVSRNTKRDHTGEHAKSISGEQSGLDDVTDQDNPAFRYVY